MSFKQKNREPLISIVIINWNKKHLIKQLLESIIKKTSYKNYEITVVDNGSTDGSQSVIKRFKNVKLIENKSNLGFPKAANIGIKNSKGNYFVLLNNDMEIVNSDWLENLLSVAMSDRRVGIVGPKLIFPSGKIQFAGGFVSDHVIIRGRNKDKDQCNDIVDVDYSTGLITRELVDKIGLFDEDYSPGYFEDTDFCFRARFSGFRIMLTPKSIIIHKESETMKEFPRDYMYLVWRRNELKFFLTNISSPYLLLKIRYELIRLQSAVLHHQLRLFLKAYLITLKNLRKILTDRIKRRWLLAKIESGTDKISS